MYQSDIARWNAIDPLADKYGVISPYTYVANNPIRLVDPDGRRIIVGGQDYSYQEDRNYDEIENDFDRDVYKALDKLYASGALNITIGEGENATEVNVLDVLINDQENNLTFKKSENSNYANNNVNWDNENSIEFIKDVSKSFASPNRGSNSPTSTMAHEIIHGYNDIYDNQNYNERLSDDSTENDIKDINGSTQFSFPNAEEKYTTELTNQVNRALNEDPRNNYGIIGKIKVSDPRNNSKTDKKK